MNNRGSAGRRTRTIGRRLYMNAAVIFLISIFLIMFMLGMFLNAYIGNQEQAEVNRLAEGISTELERMFTEAEKLCDIIGRNYDIQAMIRRERAETFREQACERNDINGRIALLSQSYTTLINHIGLFLEDGRSFKYGSFSLKKGVDLRNGEIYRELMRTDGFEWIGMYEDSQILHTIKGWPYLAGGSAVINLSNSERCGVAVAEISLNTIARMLDAHAGDGVFIELRDSRSGEMLHHSGEEVQPRSAVCCTLRSVGGLEVDVYKSPAVILDNFTQMLILLTLLVVIGFLALLRLSCAMLNREIANPIKQLLAQMSSFGSQPVAEKLDIETDVAEIKQLVGGVDELFVRIQNLIHERENAQKVIRRAQVAALQEQINPHFLYNTLDSISWLIRVKEYDKALKTLHCFAMLFRLSLSNGRNYVTIEQELDYVHYYIDVLNVRYNNQIGCEIEMHDRELEEFYLPKLLLQPLVENSIEHGIGMRESQSGNIRIEIGRAEGGIRIRVRDDGVGILPEQLAEMNLLLEGAKFPTGETKHSYGIYNVNSRLRVAYGMEYGIRFESEYGAYTLVEVRVPLCNAKGEKLP